ncbi:MAG: hypothetical protein IJ040_03810 [Lachnospiraceae bacterium]|nr:hypothetical protein [Lachnospiraceae bacterium]
MLYFVLAILIILIFFLIQTRSMAIQRFLAMELVLVLVIVSGYILSYWQTASNLREQFASVVAKNLEQMQECAAGLDEMELAGGENESVEEIKEALQMYLPRTQEAQAEAYTNLGILSISGEDYRQELAGGMDSNYIRTIEFRKKVYPILDEAVERGGVSYTILKSGHAVFAIADTDAIVPIRVLCVEVPMINVEKTIQELQEKYMLLGLIIWGIGTILVAVVAFVQNNEWKRVMHAMSVVSVGKEEWKKPHVRSNEMQLMWNSLSEIVKNVAKIDYEKYQMFQAYYRFAPKQIEKILKKTSITDVVNGDSAEIEGVLALAVMSGDATLKQDAYAKSMNHKYNLLAKHQKEQNGILLSGDSDLRMLKYMFLESQESAIQFGIDALTEFAEEGIYTKESAMLLIHQDRFTYGISGDEEQAMSFIISSDLSILQNYTKQLSDLGIRMVITDSMIDELGSQYSYRYIGFVEEKGNAFKLYEILDAYPERERRMRLRADENLQQGIHLFYQDDYYLARNAFTEALKECPSDGLAKWYLFTCEYFLNHPEQEEMSYGLFSNR